ncbi:excalibur calcium-binding domain-containing protein [Streptomyces alkaliterrae]|uniref:Excalibur calcium-binding domain-containing protein n=1 Tax=Streptomyces alkaliterrae TaxID=2213162 RepID=A0A5P0YM26_9ACTN|nr:excalibur calcium-binding domain-containing protein [Streptomyces alkaliterrae]MBB1254025.1 excalibur calcium-binding domain-containing protein [Streptomyces alkaliterrae]MBB1257753.1 excalibur calcium-binding domain-containing protein [Streptomyces alkaliterrae]MQS01365.1 hypothetical protein [Streptomyces alkaliterrae]
MTYQPGPPGAPYGGPPPGGPYGGGAPYAPTPPPVPAQRPLYRMKRIWAGGVGLLLIGSGCGALGAEDNKDTAPAAATASPAVTVTTTATATATATAKPKPAVTVTEKPKPAPTVTVTATVRVTEPARAGDGGTTASGGGGGGAVYYRNCDAARAAGAAPVYRGQPGYGPHLDRDGDGVGCE